MKKQDEAFLARLRTTFRVEAQEHLSALSRGVAALRHAAPEAQGEVVETIFREAHSLKGAARAVSVSTIEAVSHALETVFAAWKRREIVPSAPLVEAVQRALDRLTGLLAAPEGASTPQEETTAREISGGLHAALKGAREGVATLPEPLAPSASLAPPVTGHPEGAALPATGETVRIPAARLSSLLMQSEELLAAKQATGRQGAELREIGRSLTAWRRRLVGLRTGAPAPQAEVFAEFCEWSGAFVRTLEGRVSAAERSAARDQRALGLMVDRILGGMKQVLLLPASSMLEPFPRLVRELCRERGNEAELVIRGDEVKIDRRILDEMKVPLLHLVRNCVDHGIEKPEERERLGKPRQATITVSFAHLQGGKVEVVVADDGAGIDVASVRNAAVRLGLVSAADAENLGEEEALALAFQSGVSTSPIITNVSGRGLGLAIVREKVERLGGTVSFTTHAGAGTTFRAHVPLSLATFRGLFVRVGESTFVLPTGSVERALRAPSTAITTVENRATLALRGEVVAVVALADVLELSPARAAGRDSDAVHLVVATAGGKRIAFLVDEILHEQEVLLKGLGRQLPRVRNVAGATVFSSGQIVPVLYVPDLVKSAARAAAAPARGAEVEAEPEQDGKTVLVVEDSITARALLRNVLESAGFDVRVAVDGIDALTTLKTERVDLVVSDVDMPRMNGFDLTAKIRADARLAELSVVLVTALDSREDRERGIDVGANAYIVKSSFDQGNLLEVIRRLL